MNMFDLFRAHRLRRLQRPATGFLPAAFFQKLNLSVPTVFDNPPAMRLPAAQSYCPASCAGTSNYCCACAKLD
jgi:hypothetical protein